MTEVAVFDTKPYDRASLSSAGIDFRWRYLDFRLSAESAISAQGAAVACVFVNDKLDRPVLKVLADAGVKMVAFRCAGFNNLDAAAAKELGLAVTRVPAYSPYAVAEHVVALLLALNRKIHRAYNRVREMNFSIAGLEGFDLNGKTVGIVGTGKIGRIAAKILKGFGMRVLAFRPLPRPRLGQVHRGRLHRHHNAGQRKRRGVAPSYLDTGIQAYGPRRDAEIDETRSDFN
jgi:D-lactate dehydrogenase